MGPCHTGPPEQSQQDSREQAPGHNHLSDSSGQAGGWRKWIQGWAGTRVLTGLESWLLPPLEARPDPCPLLLRILSLGLCRQKRHELRAGPSHPIAPGLGPCYRVNPGVMRGFQHPLPPQPATQGGPFHLASVPRA